MAAAPVQLKRSAAAAASAELPVAAPPGAKLTPRKCAALIARLQATQDVPPSVGEMLQRLSLGIVAKGRRHIDGEAAAAILGKALRCIDSSLQAALDEAQAQVDGADKEKEERAAGVAIAESKLEELKGLVQEKKHAADAAEHGIRAARDAIGGAKSAQKDATAAAKAIECKKRQLELVEKDKYEPLKEVPAEGAEGRQRLLALRKLGKDAGFHEELLSVLPAILRKRPEKRRTFDGLAMQQLEVEFARRAGKLEAEVKGSECVAAERACDVQAAQESLAAAKDAQRKLARELVAAEGAVIAGRAAVAEAKRKVRSFPADARRAACHLSKARARVQKFHRGPLAMYDRAVLGPRPGPGGTAPRPKKLARRHTFGVLRAAKHSGGAATRSAAPGARPQLLGTEAPMGEGPEAGAEDGPRIKVEEAEEEATVAGEGGAMSGTDDGEAEDMSGVDAHARAVAAGRSLHRSRLIDEDEL